MVEDTKGQRMTIGRYSIADREKGIGSEPIGLRVIDAEDVVKQGRSFEDKRHANAHG